MRSRGAPRPLFHGSPDRTRMSSPYRCSRRRSCWLAALAAGSDPPAQLDPAPGFAAALALRLPGQPERIVADDPAILRELRAGFPAAEIDHRGVEEWPVDLDALFDTALASTLEIG